MFDYIAFDADDTLWHNEGFFSVTQQKFGELLAPYHDAETISRKLYETEIRNLEIFGYGIKGFALSMIETAIELTEGRIKGSEIQVLLDASKEMLSAPVEPLPHVDSVLKYLVQRVPLMLITKGDLFDQESKVARSGLAEYFTHIDVVSEKNANVYQGILSKYGICAERFLMVGNSLKSDVLPVVELGCKAVHIPYHTTWQHERVSEDQANGASYHTVDSMQALPDLLRDIGFLNPGIRGG